MSFSSDKHSTSGPTALFLIGSSAPAIVRPMDLVDGISYGLLAVLLIIVIILSLLIG